MTNNVIAPILTAACPQVPYETPKEARGNDVGSRLPSRAIDVLTISDNPTLSVYLSELFRKSGWAIARARTYQESTFFVMNNRAAVAVCEESLPDGSWHNAAAAFSTLPVAPALVVVSDDQALVHEVQALGGFDVLVRPLRESDVVWTIASAWHAWMKRFEGRATGTP